MAEIRIQINETRLGARGNAYVRSTPRVGANMFLRGLLVESKAKANLSRPPRRVDTGLLRASIRTSRIWADGLQGAQVGSPVKYAWYVHDGTGLYGPRHTVIRPKTKRFLRFRPKNSRFFVYARSVKGMKPNPYLVDALPAAKL